MAKAWPSGNQAGVKFDERDQTPKAEVLSIGGDIQSIAQNSTLMINERLPEAELCRV